MGEARVNAALRNRAPSRARFCWQLLSGTTPNSVFPFTCTNDQGCQQRFSDAPNNTHKIPFT